MRLIPKYWHGGNDYWIVNGPGDVKTNNGYNYMTNAAPLYFDLFKREIKQNPDFWNVANSLMDDFEALNSNSSLLAISSYQTSFNNAKGNSVISDLYNNQYLISHGNTGDNAAKNWNDGIYGTATAQRHFFPKVNDNIIELLKLYNRLGFQLYRAKNTDLYYRIRPLTYWELEMQKEPQVAPWLPKPNEELLGPYSPKPGDTPITMKPRVESTEEDDNKIDQSHTESKPKSNWFSKAFPYILGTAGYFNSIASNLKIYEAEKAGIRPDLLSTFRVGRNVVGDEASKQAYYQKARRLNNIPSFTSDMDKDLAYRLEASDKGMLLEALGDLLDNEMIRKTSAENDELQRGNIQRATEVANTNNKAINYANSLLKHLLALYYAADASSTLNYIKELLARYDLKNKRYNAIEDEIFANRWEGIIEQQLEPLQLELKNALESKDADKIAKARKAYREKSRLLNLRRWQEYLTLFGGFLKNGGKVDFTKKGSKLDTTAELLYKSTRDTVEHFYKMSKLSSNAQNRKRIKIDKLHPAKLLQGGAAPFIVYTPYIPSSGVGSGDTESSSKKSSKSGSDKDEGLELIKKLFELAAGKGLPVDAKYLYEDLSNFFLNWELFGSSMKTSDIAAMYINSMLKLTMMEHSKDIYEKARTLAEQNGALDEYAVTNNGQYVVQNAKTGELDSVSLDTYMNNRKKYVLLTNQDILNLRGYSSNMAFSKGDLWMGVVNNGIGIDKIMTQIKSLIPSIGDTEILRQGFTKHEAGEIRKGLEAISEAPKGTYEWTRYYKNAGEQTLLQINSAIKFLIQSMPRNSRAVLEMHAALLGTSVRNLLFNNIISTIDTKESESWIPRTGKASENGDTSKENVPAVLQWVLGNGWQLDVAYNIGNSVEIHPRGRYGALLTKDGRNLGAGATLQDVSQSQYGIILDWDHSSFGGSIINMVGSNRIFIKNSDIKGMNLPFTYDDRGNVIPDLLRQANIEVAEKKIADEHITDKNRINQIYKDNGLPAKYDKNGKEIPIPYMRFGAIEVITDGSPLKGGDVRFANEVREASQEVRDLYKQAIRKETGDNKAEIDDPSWWDKTMPFWNDYQKIYEGTVFVPVREDQVTAIISGGQELSPTEAVTLQIQEHLPAVPKYNPPFEP